MRELLSLLSGVGPAWSYPVMVLCAFLESAAFVGLVVPGETAMLLGGVLAASGQVNLAGMVAGGCSPSCWSPGCRPEHLECCSSSSRRRPPR
jgi:membrane protein DedA with SNARE-associated domain